MSSSLDLVFKDNCNCETYKNAEVKLCEIIILDLKERNIINLNEEPSIPIILKQLTKQYMNYHYCWLNSSDLQYFVDNVILFNRTSQLNAINAKMGESIKAILDCHFDSKHLIKDPLTTRLLIRISEELDLSGTFLNIIDKDTQKKLMLEQILVSLKVHTLFNIYLPKWQRNKLSPMIYERDVYTFFNKYYTSEILETIFRLTL